MDERWLGGTAQYALDRLDARRITLARELRGMTKRQLADRISKSPSAVTQFEKGQIKPDLGTMIKLGAALDVPTIFFARNVHHPEETQVEDCHFRALRATTQRTRKQSIRHGEMVLALKTALTNDWGVRFPQEDLSSLVRNVKPIDEEGIEDAAMRLRRHWGMGIGPIPDLLRLLEAHGVTVVAIKGECADVDAFSAWINGQPTIFLSFNEAKTTPSRMRFNAAHELGHLILHEEAEPGARANEIQSNRFAGAFLLPRESFRAECPRRWSLDAFHEMKKRWKVSVMSLARRAFELQLSSYSAYQRVCKYYAMNGRREDFEFAMEQPIVVDLALRRLGQDRPDDFTLAGLAASLGWTSAILREALSEVTEVSTLDGIDRLPGIIQIEVLRRANSGS